ncbi:tripartite motif-containing protein 16-like [Acanthopagrus schlegelii]
MEQKAVQLEGLSLVPICLDLLKDPVATPCGHSYCKNCIKDHWDTEDEKRIYSCPQCRKSFTPRPELLTNTMLAALVEQLKKTGLQAAAADLCYAGAEDVACDVCTGRKLRAVKSCLSCPASYCEKHLQPHYEAAFLKKHKLVEPSEKLQENICSRHDEVMKMFCRTDQQCICYLCSVDEHKGHDTVSAAAEWTERQRELEGSRHNIQQRIQDREEEVKLLQQEVEVINGSADKAVEHSEKIFTQLIRLMEERRSDVKQQVRSQQETEVSRVKELQEKLEQEITELKRKDAELKKLSHTEDPNQFLHNYPSLSALSESTHSSSINIRPLKYFEDVTAAVSELRDKLQDVLRDTWTNISQRLTVVDVLLSPQPKTRADFLRYSCEITLDPNTANTHLLLSEGNRKAKAVRKQRSYSDHPDRFTGRSRESISRDGSEDECRFGRYDKSCQNSRLRSSVLQSWSVPGSQCRYSVLLQRVSAEMGARMNVDLVDMINLVKTPVSGPRSSRVGVYLDHSAGILTFYSVSDTMTLLHRVQTTFTQPLYARLYVPSRSSAEFC